jgi:hypothetical protein
MWCSVGWDELTHCDLNSIVAAQNDLRSWFRHLVLCGVVTLVVLRFEVWKLKTEPMVFLGQSKLT